MSANCRVVDEKWLVGGQRTLRTQPEDGLVGDVGTGVVIGIGMHIHPGHVVVNDRMKEVGLAGHEAVEPLKTAMHRPAVERSDIAAFPGRQLVTLAEHGGAIAVEPQDLGQIRDAAGAHRGVPREAGGNLRDHAEVCAMAIATGKQRHAAGRTQRRNFEIVVAQPGLGQAIQRRHLDRPSEGRYVAEAHVVEKDDHHVGRTFRRLHLEPRRGFCVVRIKLGDWRILQARGRAARYGPRSRQSRARCFGGSLCGLSFKFSRCPYFVARAVSGVARHHGFI